MYDGVCGFCDQTVQFILRHDRGGSLRFAPLQSEFAAAVLARHASLRDLDSLVLVERMGAADEQVSLRSEAVLRLASYLGGRWRVAGMLRILPRFLRDAAYDLFARHRYRMFGRYEACKLPAPEVRRRFLGV